MVYTVCEAIFGPDDVRHFRQIKQVFYAFSQASKINILYKKKLSMKNVLSNNSRVI